MRFDERPADVRTKVRAGGGVKDDIGVSPRKTTTHIPIVCKVCEDLKSASTRLVKNVRLVSSSVSPGGTKSS
jgi:hypothetical protein